MAIALYSVVSNATNETVFEGTAKEVAKEFGYNSTDIYSLARRKKDCYEYTFIHTGFQVPKKYRAPRKPTKKEEQQKEHIEKLEWVTEQLKFRGNTGLYDPENYIDELKEQGIYVDIRPSIYDPKFYILTRRES